jgi:hypothetical protein
MYYVIVGILLFLAGPLQAGVISTIPDWDGSAFVGDFGEPETATYGQTFSLSTESSMNSFTFYVDDFLDPGVIDFQAYVYSWDDSSNRITGSSLFAGNAMSTTNNSGAGGFEEFSIDTGGINLSAGKYVAFFTASNLFDGSPGTGKMGFVNGDEYAGGSFVSINNGDNFGALSSNSWSKWASTPDLAFTITTTVVPIPAAVWLMFSALAVLGWRGKNSPASKTAEKDKQEPIAV